MEENKVDATAKDGSFIKKGIWGAIVLIAVLLLIFLWPREIKSPTEEVSPIVDETAETNGGALQVVKPVMEGDYEYEFTGVKWTFDTTSPEVVGTNQTWLKMEFADFTRNGSAITFGTPYKLGVHPGICKEVEQIETDLEEEGIPFSFVVCEYSGTKKEFVALQREKEIVVKMRETKAADVSVWKDWYKIDVTEIVR